MSFISRFSSRVILCVFGALNCSAVEVGSGAPSDLIQQRFQNAFSRNGFANLVSLPPLADVKRLGATGLVQEFQNSSKTANVKLALVKANMSNVVSDNDVLQVTSDIYAYFNSLGVNTTGYPTTDTMDCPVVDSTPCTFQFFDKSYVLFAYKSSILNGQNFAIFSPFYTKWVALGGINGLGRPVDIQRTGVTSSAGTTATTQIFSNGALYNITSGQQNGQTYAVAQPIYSFFVSNGGSTGFLGFPTSDDLPQANGRRRQTFQGGTIEYAPGGTPELRLPVASVLLTSPAGSGTLRLNIGDTAQVAAKALGTNGGELSGRPFSWSTSNSKVVTVQPSGATAVLKAVGSGSASVTVSSEGKVSSPLSIFVATTCCQVGEGAPTAAIQQAFQDAVTRSRLSILLPAQSPVTRVAGGYIQELMSADGSVRYLLGKPDRVATAYVITGEILTRYESLGGPGGTLGLPLSDPTGGRQLFENGALAGSPVRLVSGPVLAKWALLGYEAGMAGPPTAEAVPFLTFGGTAGASQAFRDGVIFAATNGPRTGQAFFVSGLILARYLTLGAAGGAFGMPVSDEFASGNQRRQNFEGGYIDYSVGDAAAQEHEAERRPSVTATPATANAGERVRLAVTGFPNGSTLRISIAGQPDFIVNTQSGSYSWEAYIPLSTRSGTVTVRATDMAGSMAAETSYAIRGLEQRRLRLTKLQGDGQAGVPGARLPQPLRVALRDEAGNPVIGAPVTFRASPNAQVVSASSSTNEQGQAEALVRLPLSEGVALITAEASGAVATFNIRSAASSLTNFPKLLQAGDAPLGKGRATISEKGALLTAAAAILRYHQNRSELPTTNGLADPAALNQFLTKFCVPDARGAQICDGFLSNPDSSEQVVNLWRLGAFVSGGLDVAVEKPDLSSVRDLLAMGSPVLLVLSFTADSAPAGGHFVDAVGVAADGGIFIHDPNASFGRTSLGEYLNGFTAGGHGWKADLAGVVRLIPRSPASTGFLLAAVSQPASLVKTLTLEANSLAGACGSAIDLPDAAVSSASVPEAQPFVSRLLYCDGSQSTYQVNAGAAQPYRATLSDLAAGGGSRDLSGSALVAFKGTRPSGQLELAPQDVSFAASAVVNAATFTPGLAPGGLMAIFGSGLAATGGNTTAEINGVAAPVIAASPFQVNAQVPPDLAPGPYTVRVRSPFGAAVQPVQIRETAPAIFVLNTVQGKAQGAVVNQDGTINTSLTAGRRGQVLTIYCTGLGAVVRRGRLDEAAQPAAGVLNGQELPPAFAGLTPGFIGLYQVNLPIPISTPPSLDVPFSLRQPGIDSNTVFVSIQ